jgi:hypothetical protein
MKEAAICGGLATRKTLFSLENKEKSRPNKGGLKSGFDVHPREVE